MFQLVNEKVERREGLIEYTRGPIRVVDLEAVELAACECYEVAEGEFDRLLVAEAVKRAGNADPDALKGVERRQPMLYGEKGFETLGEINSRLLMAGIRKRRSAM